MHNRLTKPTLLATALVCCLGTAGLASADEPLLGNRADLDTDGNGIVTREEIAAAREAAFNQADTNGDGYLSAAELGARAEERAQTRLERRLEQLDADGNGSVSEEEFISGTPDGSEETAAAIFAAFAGSDGALSLDELEWMMSPEGKKEIGFIRLDENGDGLISLDEFSSAPPPGGPGAGKGRPRGPGRN